jgi:hypothetical protein
MTFRACSREKEVRELLLRGQWPEAGGAELRAHVEDCRSCGDVALVMTAFQSARTASVGAANPGSAGVLWWRAQLRRRKAAMESIGKPILGAQIFALSITLAIAAVFALSQAWRGSEWLSWFTQLPHAVTVYFADLWTSASAMPAWGLLLGVLGLAAVALLSGVVLYIDRPRQ